MNLTEKAAYIKGLADGLELDNSTKEGKIIAALLDLVGDMTKVLSEVDEDLNYLNDYVEELDEDLGDVEEYLYNDDDECDCDCDDCEDCEFVDECDCDGDCDNCDIDDEEYFEVECPGCGEVICFDESIDPENLVCPACGEKFECLIEAEEVEE